MFEITFLGTSAAAPSVHRGLSAQIISFRDQRFLVDCGEGTQRQILRAGIGFRRLNRILITHGHLDHILGLAGLISTFTRWEAMDALEIYGGQWALERIYDLLFGVVLRGATPQMDIQLYQVKPGVMIEEEQLRVSAFPVSHRGPDCFGYLFEELPRRPFLVEKADELGIPAGPMRKDLVEGKTVKLADGRRIKPDDVLGLPRPGTRLALTGDTARTDSLLEHCRDVDALITEATYCEVEADLASRFGHITAKQAALLAKDAGAGHLYLTHISRRYRERDILDEARQYFTASTVVRDFDAFTVKRGQEQDPEHE
ncbi:MAG: ribonuclease Z [Anaerolineales bacterium]|nr:ribonuclease Z [Anaerolineales bacterium]